MDFFFARKKSIIALGQKRNPLLPLGHKRKKQGRKECLTGGKTRTKNEAFHPSGTE